jgi:hypothetical protein
VTAYYFRVTMFRRLLVVWLRLRERHCAPFGAERPPGYYCLSSCWGGRSAAGSGRKPAGSSLQMMVVLSSA